MKSVLASIPTFCGTYITLCTYLNVYYVCVYTRVCPALTNAGQWPFLPHQGQDAALSPDAQWQLGFFQGRQAQVLGHVPFQSPWPHNAQTRRLARRGQEKSARVPRLWLWTWHEERQLVRMEGSLPPVAPVLVETDSGQSFGLHRFSRHPFVPKNHVHVLKNPCIYLQLGNIVGLEGDLRIIFGPNSSPVCPSVDQEPVPKVSGNLSPSHSSLSFHPFSLVVSSFLSCQTL